MPRRSLVGWNEHTVPRTVLRESSPEVDRCQLGIGVVLYCWYSARRCHPTWREVQHHFQVARATAFRWISIVEGRPIRAMDNVKRGIELARWAARRRQLPTTDAIVAHFGVSRATAYRWLQTLTLHLYRRRGGIEHAVA